VRARPEQWIRLRRPSRRNNKAKPGGKGTVRVASQGDKRRRHMGCTGAGAPSPAASGRNE
jgi:hypothetical protein